MLSMNKKVIEKETICWFLLKLVAYKLRIFKYREINENMNLLMTSGHTFGTPIPCCPRDKPVESLAI